MKLVCSTLGFENYPIEDALEHLAMVGCDSVELVLGGAANSLELLDWRSLGDLHEALDATRLSVAVLDGWHGQSTEDPALLLRHAKATLDLASQIEAPVAVIHLGKAEPNGELVSELVSHAKLRGVKIGLEAYPGLPLSDAKQTRRWLDAMGDTHLGVVLDLGELADPLETAELLGDRLWSLRIPTFLDESIDVPGMLCTLKAHGFSGSVTIASAPNDEPPHRQTKRAISRLKPLLEAIERPA